MREVYHDSGLLIEQIDERLQGLRTKPLTQWEEFNSAASTSKACYVGLIVWLSIVAYYLSSAYKGGLLEPTLGGIFSYLGAAYVEIFLRVTSFGERHTPHIVESLQIIGYSFGGAILSFLIVKGIFRNYGSRFSPKPPKVTLSNLSLPIVPNQSNAAHPPMAASPVLEANNDQLVGKNVNDIPSPAVAIPSVSLPASPALGADSPRPKAKLPFHLNVVAGFNTIVGILSLLWAGLSLLILFSPHSEKIVFAFVFLLSAACGIMQLMAGIRLRKEKSGSRKLGIIASIVSCCSIWEYFVFPFCLICGIYTLIVLSKSDIRHFLEDPNKPRIN